MADLVNMLLQSKVRATLVGTFIGDAMGVPVEMYSADRIKKTYGRVTEILQAKPRKGFDGAPPAQGCYSDDTQLTLAVANGIIDAKGLDIIYQAKHHIEAWYDSTAGWGRTTRTALGRLAEGFDYTESALDESIPGTGNGTAMKIAPVGMWASFKNRRDESNAFAVTLSKMTHKTNVAAAAALAYMNAIRYCFALQNPDLFDPQQMITEMISSLSWVDDLCEPAFELGEANLAERLEVLRDYEKYSTEQIIEELKGGVYCYESIPFALMFFLKNPKSIDSLYEVINAGGDADSNGSMVAALLGALNGPFIFPSHLVNGLNQIQFSEVLAVADEFTKALGD